MCQGKSQGTTAQRLGEVQMMRVQEGVLAGVEVELFLWMESNRLGCTVGRM